jgi:hypothetical protein
MVELRIGPVRYVQALVTRVPRVFVHDAVQYYYTLARANRVSETKSLRPAVKKIPVNAGRLAAACAICGLGISGPGLVSPDERLRHDDRLAR